MFFGGGPDSIDHVGLYVGVVDGQNVMVEAPSPEWDRRLELPFTLEVAAA